MFKASQILGAMPDLNGVSHRKIDWTLRASSLIRLQTLSWLPVNRAASVILELMLGPLRLKPPRLVFHVENPVRQPWSDTLTILERKLDISSSKRLHLDEWIKKAREREAIKSNLLDFMERYFLHMSVEEWSLIL